MIRIAQITDTHLMPEAHQPLHGIDTDRTLDRVLELVTGWGPDRVVVSGDLSEHGDEMSYQRLAERLRRLHLPVHVIPGNHDDVEILESHLIGETIDRPAHVDLGPWALILLDSNVPGQPHGQLHENDFEQLDRSLGATAGCFKLVVIHHPPISIGSPWLDQMGLLNPDTLIERLQGSDTQAVVCGHVHQEFLGESKGIPILTTPSTCSQALPQTERFIDDQLGPGFRWFELADDGSWQTGVLRIPESALALVNQ